MEPLSVFRTLRSLATRRVIKPVVRGFTLAEMVVVLAIIGIITTIVLSGQSAYNQSLILTDTAYTVAFTLRQAQSLGLASRTSQDTQSSAVITDAGYGVRFSGTSSYLLFADIRPGIAPPSSAWCPLGIPGTPEAKPGNCRYDSGLDRIVQQYTFNRGFTTSNLCGKVGGALTCSLTALEIVFMRPETQAIITGLNGSTAQSYTCAEIHVRAPTGNVTRVVRVSQLGEISVGQTCP